MSLGRFQTETNAYRAEVHALSAESQACRAEDFASRQHKMEIDHLEKRMKAEREVQGLQFAARAHRIEAEYQRRQ